MFFSVKFWKKSYRDISPKKTSELILFFKLFTAALLIYSTLAAIYYSKVNPLTSDYDYIDYLSRSFHGRSFDSEDVIGDDEENDNEELKKNVFNSKSTYLSSLVHNKWVKTAAYSFQFAMNAIDRIPK